MRLNSAAVVAVLAASSAIDAYVHQLPRDFLTRRTARSSQLPSGPLSFGLEKKDRWQSTKDLSTALSMAFPLKEGEVSNMFQGPRPLVKERDACGVGFIANTSSGGESLTSNVLCFCAVWTSLIEKWCAHCCLFRYFLTVIFIHRFAPL